MAKKVKIEVDVERSSLRVVEGKFFLGSRALVELQGWTPDSENHRPVLTVFYSGTAVPLAQSSFVDGALTLDLGGEELRKSFHGMPMCAQRLVAYLNQQVTADDGDTWTWKPDTEAVGQIVVEWTPHVFELDQAAFQLATLKGPPGTPGADGKSAYQLAVEQGYSGTLEQWLAEMRITNALSGKTFQFSSANARKMADAIKAIFEAMGGTVS